MFGNQSVDQSIKAAGLLAWVLACLLHEQEANEMFLSACSVV